MMKKNRPEEEGEQKGRRLSDVRVLFARLKTNSLVAAKFLECGGQRRDRTADAGLFRAAWEVAQQLRKLSKLAEETGSNRSPFFHQPYADGPLYALVEAVIFYVHGVDLGPRRHEGEGSLNLSYRSVEVVARPPVNAVLMKLAQQTTETIFNDLR
jgi:hypothetical protein